METFGTVFINPDIYSLSVIFRGQYQELQNNGLKHKNTDAIVRVHARMQPYSVVLMIGYMYIDCKSTYSWSSAVKQTGKTLNSSGTFVPSSMLSSFTVVIIA